MIRNSSQLILNQQHIHLVKAKYFKDTRPTSQLEAANQQHSVLCRHLYQAATNVSLHIILLGSPTPEWVAPFTALSKSLLQHGAS